MTISFVFSQRCAGCQQDGPELCRRCRFSLASTQAVSAAGGIMAAMPFDGVARDAVVAMKYRNRRAVARYLADLMVHRLRLGRPGAARFDVVTWAPTSTARIRERGFDQAELLARAVAKQLGVPCRRLLFRAHGAPQTGRSRADRLGGPAFRARVARRPVRVLVVDDVITTGATLLAAQRTLEQAGVADVRLVAAAATPPLARVLPMRHGSRAELAKAG